MTEKTKLKTAETLNNQVSGVEKNLDTKIMPREMTDDISVSELKEKYGARYAVYLKMLRAQKSKTDFSSQEYETAKNIIESLNRLDLYILRHQYNEKGRILRDRQFDVFSDISKFLESGGNTGYIKLPTGVGKTVLFSQIIEAMGLKTMIIVPSKILVHQTGEKLDAFTDVEHGSYFQDEKNLSNQVVTITYQSLVKALEENTLNPDDYQLLILDEVHKALGSKRTETLKKFNSIKLGFTATPRYSEEKDVKNLLENEIHSMSIVEGVQEGLINRFKSIVARTTTDLSQVKVDFSGEFNEEQLEKAVNNQARNLSAVELYKAAFQGESALVNCSGVAHANAVSKLFNENNIKAEVVTGKINKEDRKRILDKFSNGEIKVLCNAKILLEGYDEPKASVALNLHPTLSLVDAEQRGGRVLRLDDKRPDKWASIVDFIDNYAKCPPVLFSEVAGSSEVSTEEKVTKSGRLRFDGEINDVQDRHYDRFNNIEVDNLKVIVDARSFKSFY